MKKYKIYLSEMFISIQGESSYAGWPCVFIRTAGCNLKCAYCDTKYARFQGVETPYDECIRFVDASGFHLVEITGGEPLIQESVPILAKHILNKGYRVLVETNGSLNIDILPEGTIRIMDIKGPSSEMEKYNDYKNIERLRLNDEVKFVIGTHEDYRFSLYWTNVIFTQTPVRKIHFSPIFGVLDSSILAEWILRDKLNVRLNVQIHKYIWPPNRRGV